MTRIASLTAPIILLLSSAFAHADTITLLNGNEFAGKIIGENETTVFMQIKSAQVNKQSIDNTVHLENTPSDAANELQEITFVDGSTYICYATPTLEGNLQVRGHDFLPDGYILSKQKIKSTRFLPRVDLYLRSGMVLAGQLAEQTGEMMRIRNLRDAERPHAIAKQKIAKRLQDKPALVKPVKRRPQKPKKKKPSKTPKHAAKKHDEVSLVLGYFMSGGSLADSLPSSWSVTGGYNLRLFSVLDLCPLSARGELSYVNYNGDDVVTLTGLWGKAGVICRRSFWQQHTFGFGPLFGLAYESLKTDATQDSALTSVVSLVLSHQYALGEFAIRSELRYDVSLSQDSHLSSIGGALGIAYSL